MGRAERRAVRAGEDVALAGGMLGDRGAPISQVANVSLLDARTISVSPWEKGMGAKIVTLLEVALLEVTLLEVTLLEVALLEVALLEVALLEVALLEVALLEVAFLEVALLEVARLHLASGFRRTLVGERLAVGIGGGAEDDVLALNLLLVVPLHCADGAAGVCGRCLGTPDGVPAHQDCRATHDGDHDFVTFLRVHCFLPQWSLGGSVNRTYRTGHAKLVEFDRQIN